MTASAASPARTKALLAHLASGGRVWLLSDLHGNAVALRACLGQMAAEDAVILLGDLLTYGCAPRETLQLVEECLRTRPSALLLGNHDALYREPRSAEDSYYAKLPDWLRESVDWTARQIDSKWFSEQLPWQLELELGQVLISHANPFGPLDWTYLDSLPHYQRALDVSTARGFQLGVFGHVHRPRLLMRSGATEHWSTGLVEHALLERGTSAVWNVGSLGQQRSQQIAETVGCLSRVAGVLQLEHHLIHYDLEQHLAQIRAADLSEGTQERLIRYHQRAAT